MKSCQGYVERLSFGSWSVISKRGIAVQENKYNNSKAPTSLTYPLYNLIIIECALLQRHVSQTESIEKSGVCVSFVHGEHGCVGWEAGEARVCSIL